MTGGAQSGGGRVCGYDNIEVKDGDRRVRVEYRFNPVQAELIREVFQRYADGDGLRTIAKDLNARRAPAPRAGRRGTGSWAPSTLHAILPRNRYRGVLVWGKKEKTYFAIKREDSDTTHAADLAEIGRTLAACRGLPQRPPETPGLRRRHARRDDVPGGRDRAGAVDAVESKSTGARKLDVQ